MLFQMVTGDLHRPLGTGWQDAVAVDDPVQADLLREDITAATHADPAPDAAVSNCQACGAEVATTDQFCEACGAALHAPATVSAPVVADVITPRRSDTQDAR